MISQTQSIVLRAVRYGETSLISTQFTREFGVQAYMVNGVRTSSARGRSSRAGLLQPAMVLDLTVYYKPHTKLLRLKDFTPALIYSSIHQDVIKNSIALFSVELLLRLLPESAPLPDLFDFTLGYFKKLDELPKEAVGNFPLFFVLECSRQLGYELSGTMTDVTPFLNLTEGGFSKNAPLTGTQVTTEDARVLAQLLPIRNIDELAVISMNSSMRQRLLEWFLDFLQNHTEHMRPLKSLPVLQAILHA